MVYIQQYNAYIRLDVFILTEEGHYMGSNSLFIGD